jgi:diaminohydroxyphosphoribosylaminopyrimidine deaminase/5-amino-6-(5-phosphoribosylamino)uracil reductase
VGALGINTLGDALHLSIREVTRLGGDVALRLRPTRHTGDRSRD